MKISNVRIFQTAVSKKYQIFFEKKSRAIPI